LQETGIEIPANEFEGRNDMSFELPPEQTGAAAWYGPEIAKRIDWQMPLSDAEVAEVEAATRALVARDADIAVLKPQDFPLPTLGTKLRARVDDEVLNGRGFLLLRGLPVDRWSIRESATAFFGLGAHLGSARSQNGKGHVLGHVQDLGMDVNDPNVPHLPDACAADLSYRFLRHRRAALPQDREVGRPVGAGELDHDLQRDAAPPARPAEAAVPADRHRPPGRGAGGPEALLRDPRLQLAPGLPDGDLPAPVHRLGPALP
jgi:hypothetical protein